MPGRVGATGGPGVTTEPVAGAAWMYRDGQWRADPLSAADILAGVLAPLRGGTGVSNAGSITNANNTIITGGGTVALGGFTLTVPATGTAVLTTGAQSVGGIKTLTNNLNLGDGTSTYYFNINSVVNGGSGIAWQTAGNNRWLFYVTNTESGSDAGADLVFGRAYTDAGAGIDNPITITRAAGGPITILRRISLAGNFTMTSGNLALNSGTITTANTTSASTSLVGAVVVGNGTVSTSVSFGNGQGKIGTDLQVAYASASNRALSVGPINAVTVGVSTSAVFYADNSNWGFPAVFVADSIGRAQFICTQGFNSSTNTGQGIYYSFTSSTVTDMYFYKLGTSAVVDNVNLYTQRLSLASNSGSIGLSVANTTSASSSIVGAVVVGNGTAATSVAIGAGNINAGAALTLSAVSGITLNVMSTATSSTRASNSIYARGGVGIDGSISIGVDGSGVSIHLLANATLFRCTTTAASDTGFLDFPRFVFRDPSNAYNEQLRILNGLVTIPTTTGTTLTVSSTNDATAIGTASVVQSGGQSTAKNILAGQSIAAGVTSTATAAGTTTLTNASRRTQIFTGVTTQTLQMPAANLFGAGVAVEIVAINRSTGSVTASRAGADTFVGGGTTDVLTTLTQRYYVSDGVSVWYSLAV